MNNMRKRSNNQRRHGGGSGGHSGGGQRRYNNNSGGGNNRGGNDGQNLARQKHHATQMREKHMNHARDAQNNGDRVDVEYYLQHVDHYNRVLTDINAIEAERQEKFREQQQANQPQGGHEGGDTNPQGNHQQPQQQEQHQGGNHDQGNGGTMEEPINPGNQPRMTRGPRHTNNNQRGNDHNGAQAANANSEEIPLPGGVIGAV